MIHLAQQVLDKSDAIEDKYAVRQALQFLAEINLTGDNLNTVRFEIIQHIAKLRAILENKQ